MDDYGESCPGGWATTEKDPDETLWLTFLWAGRLGGDEIDSMEFVLPDGLTNEDDDQNDNQQSTKVLLSGGTRGRVYRVTNRIVTTGGQTLDQTQYVKVRER